MEGLARAMTAAAPTSGWTRGTTVAGRTAGWSRETTATSWTEGSARETTARRGVAGRRAPARVRVATGTTAGLMPMRGPDPFEGGPPPGETAPLPRGVCLHPALGALGGLGAPMDVTASTPWVSRPRGPGARAARPTRRLMAHGLSRLPTTAVLPAPGRLTPGRHPASGRLADPRPGRPRDGQMPSLDVETPEKHVRTPLSRSGSVRASQRSPVMNGMVQGRRRSPATSGSGRRVHRSPVANGVVRASRRSLVTSGVARRVRRSPVTNGLVIGARTSPATGTRRSTRASLPTRGLADGRRADSRPERPVRETTVTPAPAGGAALRGAAGRVAARAACSARPQDAAPMSRKTVLMRGDAGAGEGGVPVGRGEGRGERVRPDGRMGRKKVPWRAPVPRRTRSRSRVPSA